MEGRKTDRRVKYTKQVLKQSLLELMASKPIGKITVTDVCERADVNRGTFYTHYQDAYDLLGQIEDELMAEILESLEAMEQNSSQSMIEELLLAIERNKALCRVLFSEHGDKAFLSHIIDLAKEKTIGEWKRIMPDVADGDLMLNYTFISNGCVALIAQWVREELPETPQSLSMFIDQVSRQCLVKRP